MKFIRKICLGLLLAFTLVLVGCWSKGGQKKNKAISEEQFITIFSKIYARTKEIREAFEITYVGKDKNMQSLELSTFGF